MTVELTIVFKRRNGFSTEERSWSFIDEEEATKAMIDIANYIKAHVRLSDRDSIPFEWKQ